MWNTYVGQIEKGVKVPSDEVVIKLAKVLDLNLNELLLSAYKAKADSAEAQSLFTRMETALNDPVLQQIVSSSNPIEPGVLATLGDENIRAALTEETWRESFSRCYRLNSRKKRDVQALLALVESMNDKQYSAMMNLPRSYGARDWGVIPTGSGGAASAAKRAASCASRSSSRLERTANTFSRTNGLGSRTAENRYLLPYFSSILPSFSMT